jgi:hypothetical protein
MRIFIESVALAWRSWRERMRAMREASPTRDLELRAASRRERQRLETELQRHPKRY